MEHELNNKILNELNADFSYRFNGYKLIKDKPGQPGQIIPIRHITPSIFKNWIISEIGQVVEEEKLIEAIENSINCKINDFVKNKLNITFDLYINNYKINNNICFYFKQSIFQKLCAKFS